MSIPFLILLCFLSSFGVAYLMLPKIIQIAQQRHFFDQPDHRKTHTKTISALGGIAIFVGTWCTMGGLELFGYTTNLAWIFVATAVLFGLSLIDDFFNLSAKFRLLVQLVVASLVYQAGFVLPLDDFLFLHQSFPMFNYLATVFFTLLMINAYNFIDGIDGLAGSLGVLASMSFGVLFLSQGQLAMAALAFALMGGLVAFLRFNFGDAQIYMGDNGSTVLGLVFAVFSMQLIGVDAGNIFLHSSLALGILIIPIMDLFKVTLTRILKGKSPFAGDRTHIHHRLLAIGLNPAQSCGVLFSINVAVIMIIRSVGTFNAGFALALLPMLALFYYLFTKKEFGLYKAFQLFS